MKFSLTIITLVIAQFSMGCVCSDLVSFPPVAEEHMDASRYELFTGKVINIETTTERAFYQSDEIEGQRNPEISFQLITIAVIDSYNGQLNVDTIQIATGMGAPDCGVTMFKKRKKYLFTVSKKATNSIYYWTSVCVPNRRLRKAQEDMKFIENYQGKTD